MIRLLAAALGITCIANPAFAAEPANPETPANITVDQIKAALSAAGAGHPADLAGKSLRNLDLTKLDFTGANLKGANLFGAKLAGANMPGPTSPAQI